MPSHAKLIASIINNPKGVRFDDACRVATAMGFLAKGGKGSHRTFARTGEATMLNFQNRNGNIPPYQARQLIAMMEKYPPI